MILQTSFWGLPQVAAKISLILLSISTQVLGQAMVDSSVSIELPEQAKEFSSQEIHQGWEFRRDRDANWIPVSIPSTFESHQGVGFDGIGWYRKRFARFELEDYESQPNRLILRFHGVATHATLWCNGRQIAEHLGGWTPFECDLTDALITSKSRADESLAENPFCELLLRVDELPGHNSQGFLPVFAPHFGGLWQSIQARWVAPVWIDSKELFVWGDLRNKKLHYEIPLGGIDPQAVRQWIDPSKRYRLRIELRPDRRPGELLDQRASSEEGSMSSTEAIDSGSIGQWVELSADQVQTLHREARLIVSGAIQVPEPLAWSPQTPWLYRVGIGFQEYKQQDQAADRWIDTQHTKGAFRQIEVEGAKLLLNGQPLKVRGVLNWGYAPPSVAPSTDPEHWRKELQLVKDYGFNLMKFCLWIPPKGYLELADQMGVLVWIEYPTWHSQWTKEALPKLEKEFDEFFCYDRNHPSVILRSLTCETGPSADLQVIRTLYDRCHRRIPGSIVEDDSSWIQWNRVHDFYDDHPYGNNHTWLPTLARLKGYIQEHGIKPLVLGEAIAADTWLAPGSLDALAPKGQLAELQGVQRGDPSSPSIEPFWFPLSYRANERWAQDRIQDMGAKAVARLEEDSKRYARLMRKYQIEAFGRELPDSGYVVSVIRDFPFASMGLVDFEDRPKWPKESWSWHGDALLLLKTPGDRRSFWADEPLEGQVLIDSLMDVLEGQFAKEYVVRWTWTTPSGSQVGEQVVPKQGLKQGERIELLDLRKLRLIESKEDAQSLAQDPIPATLSVEWLERTESQKDRILSRNSWDLWLLNKPRVGLGSNGAPKALSKLYLHPSCSEQTVIAVRSLAKKCHREVCDPESLDASEVGTLWIAQKFDEPMLRWLEQGGIVVLLPDGQQGSLPIGQHWFLRGGPIVSERPFWNRWHRLLVDLQHFDLAGPVVPDVQWLNEMTPLLMLWDNHDIAAVKTHGLVFASRIGQGTLLVDGLNHSEPQSPASVAFFGGLLSWLEVESKTDRSTADTLASNQPRSEDEFDLPIRQMQPLSIRAIREKLRERTIQLTDQAWEFRPDPKDQGLQLGWQLSNLPESQQSDWKPISIGKHWEALGYPGLDGWAWYRKKVVLPEDWPEGPIYLQIDGADDYVEVFVEGSLKGSAGDPKARKTAFEQKVSFQISSDVKPGDTLNISLRVEDWQGAGGLFRPIRLSTSELGESKSILK